jgi:hypothetical protein
MKEHKWILITISGLVILALAAGTLAFSSFSSASAQTSQPGQITGIGFDKQTPPGPRGKMGGGLQNGEKLAEALGITYEELQAAEKSASQAAVQQSLEAGLITQAQADRLLEGGMGFRRGLDRMLLGDESGIDMEALLAEALGVTTAELQAARQQASEAALAQAVEDGRITEDQAELMKMRQLLQGTIDPCALEAEALGVTVEDLQAYRQEGLRRDEILEKLGLTEEEAQAAFQSAYQAAIVKAAADGVITQAQADLLLSEDAAGFPFGRGMGGGRPGGGGGMRPGPGECPPGNFEAPGNQPPAVEESNGL